MSPQKEEGESSFPIRADMRLSQSQLKGARLHFRSEFEEDRNGSRYPQGRAANANGHMLLHVDSRTAGVGHCVPHTPRPDPGPSPPPTESPLGPPRPPCTRD